MPFTKYKFLSDVASKTMTCYTFSVRPTFLDSENLKIAIKKLNEEENEDFYEEEYFNFEEPETWKEEMNHEYSSFVLHASQHYPGRNS